MRWLGLQPKSGLTQANYTGVTLVDFTGGTFSRSSDGTYLTSSTTVASVTSNVRRFENRGDGAGDLILLEGARTNLVGYSNALGSWTQNAPNNIGQTNAGTAPTGEAVAGRVYKTGTGSFGPYLLLNGGTTPGWCLSAWVKDNAATSGNAERLRFSYAQGMACRFNVPATWTRIDTTEPTTMAITNDAVSWEHRASVPKATAPADPIISTTTDILVWGVTLEVGVYFPSSSIVTTGGVSATRSADSLTYTTAQYNPALRTVPWASQISPRFANTDLVGTEEHWLYSFGNANSGVRIRRASSVVKLEVVSGGSVVVASDALTFARHALPTFTVNPAQGKLTVSGASTGNGTNTGTGWTFAEAPLRIGGVYGGANEFFGRMGPPVGV